MTNLSIHTDKPIIVNFSFFNRRAAALWYNRCADMILARAFRAAWRFLSLSCPPLKKGRTSGDVISIVFSDDPVIRSLNKRWRNKNCTTNVLTFPAEDQENTCFLGDIFLSWETIQRESRLFERSLEAHLSHLGIHGFLHLGGMDHQNFLHRREMEKTEAAILSSIGYRNPYHDY